MRKLTVKNFSVIKEAELEFGKITVLIGPQSSGKSLLCKLAYFLQQVVVEKAEESMKASEEFDQFLQRVVDAYLFWFGDIDYKTEISEITSEIRFRAGLYEVSHIVEVRAEPTNVVKQWNFSQEFETCYNEVRGELNTEKGRRESLPNPQYFANKIKDKLLALRERHSTEIFSYIPANRSVFLTIYEAIFAIAGRRDNIQLRFSQDFDYGFETRIPKAGLDHPLTHWINSESERILQGKIIAAGSNFLFKSTDGRTLLLPVLSSGTQELLPLITCLREYVAASASVEKIPDFNHAARRQSFFLEEPESNIFPSTQYDLVRIFVRMANEPTLDATWVITTHSPYILTAFNTLIQAWRAGNKEGKREQVAAIIPEKYWINESDFAAYSIHDGVLTSIFSKEEEGKEGSGLIDGDFLDSVSDQLGSEFDRLLDIEYAD